MKLVIEKNNLVFRLGATIGMLLFGQQAMAVGTPAGEVVDNTASVVYEVATVLQAAVPSNTVSFVVDRRVTFTLAPIGAALVPVTPGENDAFVDFLLSNTSNSALDFNLLLVQAGVVTVRGVPDTADMDNAEYAVSADFISGADPDPIQGGGQFVDELPADDAIRIRVWGDAALALLDGLVAGLDLSATAAEPGTAAAEGAALVDGTNVDANIDNVFADAGGDGVEVATDGFIVAAADLTVAKSFAIIDGDLGSGLPIPGARIEYTIVITNAAGAATADDIIISDIIDDDLLFLDNAAGSDYTDIQVDDGGGPVECTADVAVGDTDGCSLDGVNLVVGNAATRIITIAAGGSYTVRFQVRIPDPATTPPPSP
jgi:uncharacterized repeat protein (TIGR01451 family)